ncbi:MAG: EthD domain-containing protein [Novosphingobium sp.]|nr:EthD domain-containing protein [Novosphingobium sp.]MCP5389706.1 EthD domain-containing protein [Novosphingobium sp.]
MIKMVVNVYRKPGMSKEEFDRYWLEDHGALVRRLGKAMGFVRYVQSHNIPDPDIEAFRVGRGWDEPSDGITEVWWESRESMEAALASEEGQRASQLLYEDEQKFVDAARSSAFLSKDDVIFDNL